MKLFLSSLAISKRQLPYLLKLVGKQATNIRLALIENAADPYDRDHRQWMVSSRTAIESHGFDVEIIDLRQYRDKLTELEKVLSQKDIIWCGGGNTYYLRWLLKDTGADELLRKLVHGGIVYGGGSAGAIIAGPTLKHFEAADDPHDAPEVLLEGLRFTGSVIVPHMDNAKFSSIIHGINDALQRDGFKTVPLGDKQALVINGSSQELI